MQVTKFQNHIGIFRSKSFVFVVLIKEKGFCRDICFNEGFVCNCIFNNRVMQRSENSTNALKFETRT